MALVDDASDMVADTPTYAQLLAAVLAATTVLVFGISRVLLYSQGYELPNGVSGTVMVGVIAATVGGGVIAAHNDDGITTGAMIALGSPVGMAAYLLVVVSLEGPSSDSPTWLPYLGFTGFFLVVGAIGYGVGLATRRQP